MPMLEGGFVFEQTAGGNTIALQRETAMIVYDNVVAANTDQYARQLGLYSSVNLNRDLEGVFASFDTPKHLFSNRKKGCTWNPKGKLRMNVDTFPTCPIEYNGEQCPDVFYDNCFERIFNGGNGITEMAGTAEGQALLAKMVSSIYRGLGNSMFELYNFAGHPLITNANANGTYRVGVDEWEDYTDQMLSGNCGGLITQLDALKAEGVQGYTTDVPYNTTTGAFSGTFADLFNSIKDSASADFQTMIDNGVYIDGVRRDPIILVSKEIYQSYKNFITAMAGTNELAYRYMIENSDGTTSLSKNILMYDGLPVIQWEAVSQFDALVGTKSHRMAIVAPGNFGVLANVQDVQNMMFNGMGLVIQQSPLLRDKGKYEMATYLRWGAGIANTNLCAMASTILHP